MDRSTICRDVDYLRQQAKENITRYVDQRLPEEYEKCLVGFNSILKEAWTISHTAGIKGDKIRVLALAKDCYAMKLELLTNISVIEDAIRFVASHDSLPKTIEKTSSENGLILGGESVGIKRSDEDRSHYEQQSTVTNNITF